MPLSCHIESGLRINSRGLGKPNEDLILIDREQGIFFLLDGITRVHQEYRDHPGHSAAGDVGRIFSEAAHAFLLKHPHMPPAQLLREAAIAGNNALLPYRRQKSLEEWQFYPGTLGILAILREDTLHFVYNGDCLGMRIRNGETHYFGRQQQTKQLEEMKISKADRYNIYCNHPEHPLGYGIFNGDPQMAELLDSGCLELCSGDTILLCSDGIGDYMQHTDPAILIGQTPEQMLDASTLYDAPPYATYADDKAILKLQFE